jgi:5-keto 4-deoxyuronate isomerase
MNNNYQIRYAVGQRETNQMGTQALRDEFLIEQVFGTDALNYIIKKISINYSDN